MLKDDRLSSDHNFTLPFFQVAKGGLDRPHGVIHLLVDKADFLVAREASIGQRSDWHTMQVEGLVHKLSIRGNTHLLAKVDAVVG